MSRSGGIPYHLKALRFKNSHWGSHEDGVRRFLDSWNPKSRHLLLIGPSGGYSLPRGWLDRFETVSAFDPDLLARVIIEKLLGRSVSWLGTRFEFAGSDLSQQIIASQ